MLLYILIFSLVSACSIIESRLISKDAFYISRQRKILNWAVLLFMIVLSGTRLIGGSDYMWYENAYNTTPVFRELIANPNRVMSVSWTSTLDYGYLLICSVFKSIGITFHIFCLFEATFFYIAMYRGLGKYCNNFSIVLLVFLAKMFFYDTFISMRQSITIAIFFLALPLIEQRKLIKYMAVCLLCFFIHAGSIIIVVAYFLTYIKISKRVFRNWILLFTPFALFGIFGINIISLVEPMITKVLSFSSVLWAMKAKAYLSGNTSSLSVFYILEYILIAVLIYYNYERIVAIDVKTCFFIKVFMVIWPLFALFSNTEIITREKDYFILSYGILLCYLSHMKERRYKQLYTSGAIVICAYEYFRFIHNFDGGGMIPYLSWLV